MGLRDVLCTKNQQIAICTMCQIEVFNGNVTHVCADTALGKYIVLMSQETLMGVISCTAPAQAGKFAI